MRGHAAGRNPAEPSSTLGRLSSRHGPVVQRPGPRILNPATRVRFPPGSPPRRVRPVAQDAGPSSRRRGFESHTRPAFSSACSSDREERRFGGPEGAGSSPATLTSSSGCSSAWLQSTRSGTVRARVRISPPRLHLPPVAQRPGPAPDRRVISVRIRAGGPSVRVAQRLRAPRRGPGYAGSTPVPHPVPRSVKHPACWPAVYRLMTGSTPVRSAISPQWPTWSRRPAEARSISVRSGAAAPFQRPPSRGKTPRSHRGNAGSTPAGSTTTRA